MKSCMLNFRAWFLFSSVLILMGVCAVFILLTMTQHIQHEIAINTQRGVLQYANHKARHSLHHIKATSSNVAQILGSLKFTNASSLHSNKIQVFPSWLFVTYKTLELVSQISYVSKDKLLFSYYKEGDQTYALQSNNSYSSNSFVSQKVDVSNGKRYGDKIAFPHLQPNESKWYSDALNGVSGYPSWGVSFGKEKQKMMFFTATTPNQNGVISLGITMEDYKNHVLGMQYNYGTQMYLYSSDGYIYEKNSVAPDIFHSSVDQIDSFCNKNIRKIGKDILFDCFPFDIGGIKMVTAAMTHVKEVATINFVRGLNIGIITLLCILIVGMAAQTYMMLLLHRQSIKTETGLKVSLIKLKDAVQQAERKSMNKSLAFASASHDVRNSLSGITGLIELCRKEVQQNHALIQLNENLVQMHACASELLEIVNSVLDMSKVEAGKMQLAEAEFDISRAIEESVDLCNISALEKGLEVIWDPCNFSILMGVASRVKGDCRRFKQILDNLLCNARKFTQSGHIILRGWASSDNPDLIEFVFEVDDTGIGIPNEKRESIFENYVQVKESSFQGPEGTGLGLGIVQSFVRLMGGEIGVIDKKHGERGTCFRFNIFLKAVDSEDNSITRGVQELAETVRAKGKMKSVLLISGDETRRILKQWLENIGIEANIVKNWEHADPMLVKNMYGISKRSRSSRSFSKLMPVDLKTEDQILSLGSNDVFCSKRFKEPSLVLVLIFIDIDSCGGFSNMCCILDKFSKFKSENCIKQLQFKVVSLVNMNTQGAEIKRLEETSWVLKKPIHGSRLLHIIRMIQDFGAKDEENYPLVNKLSSTSKIEVNVEKEEKEKEKQLMGMKILLVEDTMIQRRIAMKILSGLGAEVEVAENGLIALNMVKNALQKLSYHNTEQASSNTTTKETLPYDVIFMDCEMSVMNGFEATKSIREEEKKYGIQTPIIALTGHTDQDQIDKALSAGMSLHLTKPINDEKVLEIIGQVKQY